MAAAIAEVNCKAAIVVIMYFIATPAVNKKVEVLLTDQNGVVFTALYYQEKY